MASDGIFLDTINSYLYYIKGRDELIANKMGIEDLAGFLGADSLGYISLDGLLGCVSQPVESFCTACWSGKYKMPIHDDDDGKFALERHQRNLFEDLEIENG